MGFSFEKTELDGLLLLRMHVFSDHRGVYCKNFEKNVFLENGLAPIFTEASDIYSNRGVLRGLHYQTREAQAKLLHVLQGSLYDVVVDIRPASATFGKWHGELLHGGDGKAIYIPESFAHGFLSLEDHTIFSYQCTGRYLPEACGGIAWNDPDLGIDWHRGDIETVILSEKDNCQPSFAQFQSKLAGK